MVVPYFTQIFIGKGQNAEIAQNILAPFQAERYFAFDEQKTELDTV